MDTRENGRIARGLRSAAPYLALTAIVLAVYADPLFTERVFFYRDLGRGMRPVLAEGRIDAAGHADPLPLWTHSISNGRPLLANPGYSLLEPLNVLFPILPFPKAFNLFLVLHVAVAGCAMAFLANRLGCSGPAMFAAGAAYALGGGLVSAMTLYWTVVAAAWAPLVVAAGLGAVEKPTLRRVFLLAVTIGLQAIGGQPEPVVATLLVGVVASLVWIAGTARRRLQLVTLSWGFGLLGGLALAAPQLLPAALHARTTIRALGFTPEGLLYNSLHPLRALWLVVPGLGGNPIERLKPGGFPGASLLDGASPYLASIYLGIVAVSVGIAGLVLGRRSSTTRPLAWTLAGLALFGIVVASGRHVPGVSALVAAFPFPIPLRFPEKALYVTFLVVPLLTAFGIDSMRSVRIPRFPVLLVSAVVLDLVVAHSGYAPTIAVADLGTPPLARELSARSRSLGIPDAAWRLHHQRQRSSGGWGPPAGSIQPTEEDMYRWQVRMLVPPTAAPYGIHAAMDLPLDQLEDMRYFALTVSAYNGPPHAWPLALGEAGVLWVISPQSDLDSATSGDLVREIELGPTEGVPAGSGYVYRNTRFVPRARLTDDVSSMRPPSFSELPALVKHRFDAAPALPPATVVEAGSDAVLPMTQSRGEVGSVTAIVEDHRGLTLSVAADRRAVLVLSDVPGEIKSWRAEVDGRTGPPVWRANFAYLALPIEPGRHEIRLNYRPAGFRAGVVIMLVSLLVGAAAMWPRHRRA